MITHHTHTPSREHEKYGVTNSCFCFVLFLLLICQPFLIFCFLFFAELIMAENVLIKHLHGYKHRTSEFINTVGYQLSASQMKVVNNESGHYCCNTQFRK